MADPASRKIGLIPRQPTTGFNNLLTCLVDPTSSHLLLQQPVLQDDLLHEWRPEQGGEGGQQPRQPGAADQTRDGAAAQLPRPRPFIWPQMSLLSRWNVAGR